LNNVKTTRTVDEHVQHVRTIFDDITPSYDLLNRIMSARRDVRWRRRLAGRIDSDAGRIIDIAAGTGDQAIEVLRHVPHAGLFCLDFVPRMLDIARMKALKSGLEDRIDFCIGDATGIPFADNSFDASVIAFGLRNIPDKARALKEMIRVVKPGGKVLCLEMSFPENLGFRGFFSWYLNRMIPFIGGLISRNRAAYRYLPNSIQGFLRPEQMTDLFRQAGLTEVRKLRLTSGIAHIHEGIVR